MAPHVLEVLFEQSDGRRDLLAEGLGVDTDGDPTPAIIEAVTDIREGLPSRLHNLDGAAEVGLRRAAELAHHDAFMSIGPDGFEPTVDDVEAVFKQAW